MSDRPRLPSTETDMYRSHGLTRSDMYCHDCSKNFVAIVNHDLDGQHVIECPHCAHKHYRIIKSGAVTGERHSSDSTLKEHRAKTDRRGMWKSTSEPVAASSASHFMRDMWLRRGMEE